MHHPGAIQQFTRIPRGRWGAAFILALCLSLLFVQTTAAEHSHDGRPLYQFDCDFCLKLSTSDDALPVTSIHLDQVAQSVDFFQQQLLLPFIALPAARSRAPPSL